MKACFSGLMGMNCLENDGNPPNMMLDHRYSELFLLKIVDKAIKPYILASKEGFVQENMVFDCHPNREGSC